MGTTILDNLLDIESFAATLDPASPNYELLAYCAVKKHPGAIHHLPQLTPAVINLWFRRWTKPEDRPFWQELRP